MKPSVVADLAAVAVSLVAFDAAVSGVPRRVTVVALAALTFCTWAVARSLEDREREAAEAARAEAEFDLGDPNSSCPWAGHGPHTDTGWTVQPWDKSSARCAECYPPT